MHLQVIANIHSSVQDSSTDSVAIGVMANFRDPVQKYGRMNGVPIWTYLVVLVNRARTKLETFLCSLTRCLAPAPQKLRPYGRLR